MRILFGMTTYQLFLERCKVLAGVLRDLGHEIRVVTHAGSHDAQFPTYLCQWPNFDMKPILDFNPDLVILWNGHFPYMNAAAYYLKKRYLTATMELGWYTQTTHSYMTDELAQISRIARLSYEEGVAETDANQQLLAEVRAKYATRLPAGVVMPEECVFIPMQLEYDTQITETSPMFRTMVSQIGYAKLIFPGIPIVVRNHPQEHDKRRSGVIDYTDESPSLPLALKASLVLGINSTVLAETILHGKLTVALGHHVAGDVLNQNIVLDYLKHSRFSDLRKLEESLRPQYDYRALVLIRNQWARDNPPGWLIDKINNLDLSPVIPQK